MNKEKLEDIVINERGFCLLQADGTYKAIAPRIEYAAYLTVEGSRDKFVAISFQGQDGEEEVVMPRADFYDFRIWLKRMLNSGYELPPRDKGIAEIVFNHLVRSQPRHRRRIVARIGWHGDTFVLPGVPVQHGDAFVVFERPKFGRAGKFGQCGNLDDWKKRIAGQAAFSSRLMFSISLAFAAPLLRFTEFDGCGIHLEGLSSRGKTTCLLAAASVSGEADKKSLLSWDVTEAGLAETAMGHNHTLMCIDEIGRADGNAAALLQRLGRIAYMLAGGVGRVRSAAYGATTGAVDCQWQIFFLSTGEKALSELAHEAEERRMKGHELRLIDLPAVVSDQWGIYERLPDGFSSSRALSESIETACRQHYGLPLRTFVANLAVDASAMRDRIDELVSEFMEGVRVPDEGWERRFARPFALSYAAARLAAQWGIVPWRRADIGRSIKACYVDARKRVPDARKLRAEGLARIKVELSREGAVLPLHRIGQKVSWTPEQARAAAAFMTGTPAKGRYFLITRRTLEGWLGSAQAKLMLEWMGESGHLIKDDASGLPTHQVKIHGLDGRHRYYFVKASLLQEL